MYRDFLGNIPGRRGSKPTGSGPGQRGFWDADGALQS